MSTAPTDATTTTPPEPNLTPEELIARAIALRPELIEHQADAEARAFYSEEMHQKFLDLGLESPYGEDWFNRPSQDDRITTHIDLSGGFNEIRAQALLAHATQVDPTSPFWFGLPPEVARDIYPFDDYVLAQSRVETELPETDLFAGLR